MKSAAISSIPRLKRYITNTIRQPMILPWPCSSPAASPAISRRNSSRTSLPNTERRTTMYLHLSRNLSIHAGDVVAIVNLTGLLGLPALRPASRRRRRDTGKGLALPGRHRKAGLCPAGHGRDCGPALSEVPAPGKVCIQKCLILRYNKVLDCLNESLKLQETGVENLYVERQS